ncbi:pyridoxal phosphate-dependent aminotransferase [Eubacterium sp. MSJ-13]|uniref:pyridoxal phosphate-dependent aminotransferase n=1 Tax=Eubacterium sp. MSJ-13 TaxID=2841513 RepID=UPI001C121B79|nr:pyridoxal phosphate-dependent aminotransferase [Eubacterium sp. MSJ-13]MBU5479213.1 pyridoxal phosphate-dependent aminotransferase [Eubacterium sp. MSJ-13]
MSLELSKKAAAVKPSSTLAITAKAKELKAQGKDVVGFGAGEPDFNTPENICEAAIKAIKDGFTKYTPASGTNELKEAISKKFKEFNGLDYAPDQIVISNGGKHSLTNIFTALLNPGDEVIIPAPFWLSYPEIVKLAGGVPVIVTTTKEQNFKLTAEDLAAAVTDKTKALVLNTPNNPTGMLYTEEELRAIAKVAVEKDFYVVADEMYEMLVYGEQKHISIASLGKDIYDRTITCSGLAKSYAMTGWRIGYTGSSKEIAKMMGSVQSHQTSNPNSIAQKAAVEALTGPQDSVEKMHAEFDKRRKYMYKRICDMPLLDTLEPMGAFYVFVDGSAVLGKSYKGTKIESVPQMADILINEYNTAIVPCADFGFPDCFRLSYAISIEQIEKGLDRIESFIKELA